MPNAKKEKELCLGIKKISAPRPYKGVVNTISEKLEQKESQIKFTRKHGDFIFYFD